MDKLEKIAYTIRRSRRARHIRISVACDSSVTVTLPWQKELAEAEKFFHAKLGWVKKVLRRFQRQGNVTRLKSGRREYLAHKAAASDLARQKVEQFNRHYNFFYRSISIKNQKTRWGSCSKKGNLNFNYKIVHLPEPLLDYLIVHELCHLAEFNHSPKFWRLVERTIPDYRFRRRRLMLIG